MCIILSASGRVQVEKTRIFARPVGERQLLVYQMHLATTASSAMILPVPIGAGVDEDAVVFRDVSAATDLFAGLARGFPSPRVRSVAPAARGAAAGAGRTLQVHQVGAFEASFAPNRADLDRIDPRFRLPASIWRNLPEYDDWGFVVFQFRAGVQEVHPMAFEFPSREPDALFFPTVHVHDGMVHPTARFDHELYLQGPTRVEYRGSVFGDDLPPVHDDTFSGEASGRAAGKFASLAAITAELVDIDASVLRLCLRGSLANEDTWLVGQIGRAAGAPRRDA